MRHYATRKHMRKAMKILLAVDGSEFGDAAVEEIANRPWPSRSEVHVISVIRLPFTPTPETRSLPDSYYSQLEKAERERAESAINRAVARLRESDAERETPLTLTSEVFVGHPAETIIEYGEEVGRRSGRARIARVQRIYALSARISFICGRVARALLGRGCSKTNVELNSAARKRVAGR